MGNSTWMDPNLLGSSIVSQVILVFQCVETITVGDFPSDAMVQKCNLDKKVIIPDEKDQEKKPSNKSRHKVVYKRL